MAAMEHGPVSLDEAALAQHGAAGGKATVTVTNRALPNFLNTGNDMFQDIMELINNSKAKADKRNADSVSR
jgi:hypothetical protein